MENIIDINLVKEQLRLLGHDVADEVILQFVKGLNRADGNEAQVPNANALPRLDSRDVDMHARCAEASSNATAWPSSKASPPQRSVLAAKAQNSSVWKGSRDTDAAPSKLQQAPDQQSPKRVATTFNNPEVSTAATQAAQPANRATQGSMQRTALDQRCRNYLARHAEGSDTHHMLQSLEAAGQRQQQASQQLEHPIAEFRPTSVRISVPQLQPVRGVAVDGQISDSDSSELLLHSPVDLSSDSRQQSDVNSMLLTRPVPVFNMHRLPHIVPQHLTPSSGQRASHLQMLHDVVPQASQVRRQAQLPEEESCSTASESESDSSAASLEAEGSKFLMHQAATMQRVRARLAAKMAGYNAAVTASDGCQSQVGACDAVDKPPMQQLPASACDGPVDIAQLASGAKQGSSSSTAIAKAAGTEQVPAAAAHNSHSNALPRFGFRPGYQPVGIHLPPPLTTAAVDALNNARTLRQQAAAGHVPCNTVANGASLGEVNSDNNTHILAASASRLRGQQQQDADGLLPPALMLSSHSSVLSTSGQAGNPSLASPGKPVVNNAVHCSRASGSIIAGEPFTSHCAALFKPRQPPQVDPMYLIPPSPRGSNPATPRSSPARASPAAVAPLSGCVVEMDRSRSPGGAAAASAALGLRRHSSSGSSRHSQSQAKVGGLAVGTSKHQQQRGVCRSAPASPAASQPVSVRIACSQSGGGAAGGSSSTRRSSSSVSCESLYCQRLAHGCQRTIVAPGVRKTDRVARFQEMQQQWKRDRFLNSGAGGAAAKRAAGPPSHD